MKTSRFLPLAPRATVLFMLGLVLSGCGGDVASQTREVDRDEYNTGSRREQLLRQTSAAGTSGGINIFGGGTEKGQESGAGGGGLGVNAFLWRATLDTLSFMPLASADPYGGVIITDWYVNPEKPDERFKATVYILDSRLRADGLNVALFRQTRDASGSWTDAQVNTQTEIDLENAILTRARQVRLSDVPG